jgi:hypothetical protein
VLTKLALGAVLFGDGAELAYATAGTLIPMAAIRANATMARLEVLLICSPFKETYLRVGRAIVRAMRTCC